MWGNRRRAAALAVALLACMPAVAQIAGFLYVRPQFELYFPLDTYPDPLTGAPKPLYSSVGFGGGLAADFSLTPWLSPFVRFQYVSVPYSGGSSLQSAEGDVGVGLTLRPTDRLSLRLDAMGGLTQLTSTGLSGPAYAAGGRLGIGYRLSPEFTFLASGGYTGYFGSQSQILSAFETGLYLSYDLSSVGGLKPRLSVEDVKLDAVFPSLYAYYDDNPFGTVKVVNREDAAIRDIKVSFNAGRFMDQPKVCAQYPRLEKGATATVPISALFTDSVLDITQNIDAKGEIVVEYSYLGSDRVVRTPVDFQMHHRNAITWSDDRRAAAFVSPTNPAALWFSRFASGIVRDRLRGDVNKPLQYAIGMFEAERLYGLNYVVVPANDYSVKHGLKDYIDSVQFPHQTLSNRGGDCSDLAILFATLMQSVGIEAAFITIPGHIFAAFDTGLDVAKARESFYDTGLLIFRDGHAWIPVEITMVNDGFIKAWRVAAKEWADNERAKLAAFYRLPDCWKVYPSAAFPDVNPRFSLPDEAETALAFDQSLDRFVAREIDPELHALETKLAKSSPEMRANEVGILYANFGMLKESWKFLSTSAKTGYQKAWTNLGNVAYLRKDFKLALSYYQWARQLDADDDDALLGVARCQYELEDFNASDSAYAELRARNPKLAGKFGYLASIFGGEGRAWSLADRFATTSWATSSVAQAVAPPAIAPIAIPAAPGAAPVAETSVEPAPQPTGSIVASQPGAEINAPAPPTIADELPTDTELAQKVADAASQKDALAADTAVASAPTEPATAPLAPPTIASELPTDKDLVAKAEQAATQKATSVMTTTTPAPTAPAAPQVLAASPTQPAPTTPVEVAPPQTAGAPTVAIAPAQTVTPPSVTAAPTQAEVEPSVAPTPPETVAAPTVIAPGQTVTPPSVAAAPTQAEVEPSVVPTPPETVAVPMVAIAPPSVAAAPTQAEVEPSVVPAPPQTDAAPTVAIAPPSVAAAPTQAEVEPSVVPAPPQTAAVAVVPTQTAPETSAPASVVAGLATSPVKELLIEGFDSAVPIVGTWRIENGVAKQTDKDAFFAKLGSPLVQDRQAYNYAVTAKSDARGRGWVGVGLHVFTPKSYTQKGYGAGDSICVWLTRDPVHFAKDITRLQLYRSTNDWRMKLVAEVPVAESIYDANRFEVAVDPVAGTVSVSLNGTERLVAKKMLDLREGVYVLFRALDTAEFSDFRAEAANEAD